MSTEPKVGEVWFADLGIAAKSRPVLILAFPRDQDARVLVIVAPLTSQIREATGEIDIGRPHWLLKRSAINLQGLASFDRHKLSRRMGILSQSDMARVKEELRFLLGL